MEPIGAYRTHDGTGWAAYDKRGLAWRVSEAEAMALQPQHPKHGEHGGQDDPPPAD